MIFRLRTWLLISMFSSILVFSVVIFVVVNRNLTDSLIQRTKIQLTSVNILKRQLIWQILDDRNKEILHIIQYQASHGASNDELISNLLTVENVEQVDINRSPSDTSNYDDLGFYGIYKGDEGKLVFNYLYEDLSISLDLNFDLVHSVLSERTGLGSTGESYIVNSDSNLMSPSLFFPDEKPESIFANTFGVKNALAGASGTEIYDDYRQIQVIGSYRPLDFRNLRFAVLTEIDFEEAMEPIIEVRNRLITVLGLIALGLSLLSAIVAHTLSRPVREMSELAYKLSKGILPRTQSSSATITEYREISNALDELVKALKKTVSFAEDIGKGKMDSDYNLLSDDDELGKSILQMREQLNALSAAKDAIERDSKNLLLDAQEKERTRIARDLHDSLGASLTTLKMHLENIPDFKGDQQLNEMLSRMINETRLLARNLMPSVLMDFGLEEALEEMLRLVEESTGVKTVLTSDSIVDKTKLDHNHQVYIYRIVQEAVNNALKHSGCSEIRVSITEFDDYFELFLKDNGKGIDNLDSKNGGMGIQNIKERVSLMEGDIEIHSNGGTSFEISIPTK